MSRQDLLKVPGVPLHLLIDDVFTFKTEEDNTNFQQQLKKRVSKALIINIYLKNGTMIKIGDGSLDMLKISSIINISDTFLTIQYDSHETDILYSGIVKIEYFYKDYGGV